jgi:hypothetical protein
MVKRNQKNKETPAIQKETGVFGGISSRKLLPQFPVLIIFPR